MVVNTAVLYSRVDLLRGKTRGETLYKVHSIDRELYWYLELLEVQWLGILSNNHFHGTRSVGKCLPSIWGPECPVISVRLPTRTSFHILYIRLQTGLVLA